MAGPDKSCSCGNAMKIAAIDVGQNFKCPVCHVEVWDRQRYALDESELNGMTPLVYLVKRSSAAEETRDVPIPITTPRPGEGSSEKRRPSERQLPANADPIAATVPTPHVVEDPISD